MPRRSPRVRSVPAAPPPVDLLARALEAAQILDRIGTPEGVL